MIRNPINTLEEGYSTLSDKRDLTSKDPEK